MLNLKFSAFFKALVESFPDKKEAIRDAVDDFEHQMEATRQEISQQDASARTGWTRSRLQGGENFQEKSREGKIKADLADPSLGHERGKYLSSFRILSIGTDQYSVCWSLRLRWAPTELLGY